MTGDAGAPIERLCVFCGSRPGATPAFLEAAEDLGHLLAARGKTLVYGGGGIGLMGALADAALARGGTVIGVIPEGLATPERRHPGVRDMRVVPTMHARKALMADLADAFVALPGGLGTLEELLEVWTWAQLGLHRKPMGVLNTTGYFDPLLRMADHAVAQGFVRDPDRRLLVHAPTPDALLEGLLEPVRAE